MTRLFIAGLLSLLPLAGRAIGQNVALSDDRLRDIALRVVQLDYRRQLPTPTVATIDSLLALYSDSVVYEHPNVGAVIRGKAVMRAGMQRYIGSVRTGADDVPQVTIGPDVAIIETPAHPDPRNPSVPIPAGRKAFRVLEFDAQGLVRRIIDYPW